MPLPQVPKCCVSPPALAAASPMATRHLVGVQSDDVARRRCRRRTPVQRGGVKAAPPQFRLVLPAGQRQPLEDLQPDTDGGHQIAAGRARFLGHRKCGGQDAGGRVRKAGVVEVQQMREGAVGPRRGNGAGAQAGSKHARLRCAALRARDIQDNAPRWFHCRGERHAGAIQDMPLRRGDRLGADVGDAGLTGELGKDRCCSHGCSSLWRFCRIGGQS